MKCIDQWASELNLDYKGYTVNLAKILIPKAEVESALDSLDKMNVNYFTLFPDMTGAAHYSNFMAVKNIIGG